jgi:hypothetical protein
MLVLDVLFILTDFLTFYFQPSEDKVVHELSAVSVRSSCFHVLDNIFVKGKAFVNHGRLLSRFDRGFNSHTFMFPFYFDMPDEIKAPSSTPLACVSKAP